MNARKVSGAPQTFGRVPVALNLPVMLPRGPMPVRSRTKMSCISTCSSSTPATSLMLVNLRVPSLRQSAVNHDLNRGGEHLPDHVVRDILVAIITMVSMRANASRAELACVVVIEPSVTR